MDIEDYRFIGLANTVAMEEFSASFNDDRENSACLTLLKEYNTAGSPKNKRKWLRDRLASMFVCLASRPIWIESTPEWPFFNGQPMTFLSQFSVGESGVSSSRLSPNSVLYIFGVRIPTESGGWEMRYQVVEQLLSLSTLRDLPPPVVELRAKED